MEEYAGKVAVITGGTSGLGYELAKQVGARGARVVITGRNAERGAEVEADLQAQGLDVKYIQQDVSSEEGWGILAKQVAGTYGKVDYLFNNAGVMTRPNSLMKLSINDWKWIVETNFWGPLYGLRTFSGLMFMQEGGGRIVTTSSTGAVAPFSGWAPYSVTKTALMRLVECYQTEALKFGLDKVKYNVALPGVFESGIANSSLHRNAEFKNEGVEEQEMPLSKAGTPAGNALGMITAAETAESMLADIDAGKFYLLPHPDLTEFVVNKEAEALNGSGEFADQAVIDFAFYAQKLAAAGQDAGDGANVSRLSIS